MENTQNNMLPGASQYSFTIMYGLFCFTNFVIVIDKKMFFINGLLMFNWFSLKKINLTEILMF